MLVLERVPGEWIAIDVQGVRVWLCVVEAGRRKVRLGFDCRRDEATVVRDELLPPHQQHGAKPEA